jgi:ABC-2 type transport system ATP-binding protein
VGPKVRGSLGPWVRGSVGPYSGAVEPWNRFGVHYPMLEARALGKFYSGIPAVKNVNFTLARGGVLGLLGPNGSGKSTTVSMVTSLIEPTTGQILLDGVSIGHAPLEYKARIGYVPEEAHLYTYLSGPEYLELVGQLRGVKQHVLTEKITCFMRLFGLEDDRYAPMSAYSKGMRQKILISAALLHDPDIIILDEPNSGLDVTSTLVLRSLVQQLALAGKMVLYSSHVLEMVESVATDVLILHDSNVVAHDSVSRLRELMALPSLEQVFRKVVLAADVDQVARDLVGVMQL